MHFHFCRWQRVRLANQLGVLRTPVRDQSGETCVTTLKGGVDSGCEVVINGAIHQLVSGDRAPLCALLTGVQDEEMRHVEIRRPEGDAFSVHLNRDRGFPMYLRKRNDDRCIFPVWDAQQPWAQEQFAAGAANHGRSHGTRRCRARSHSPY
jgi:hypothetical protein